MALQCAFTFHTTTTGTGIKSSNIEHKGSNSRGGTGTQQKRNQEIFGRPKQPRRQTMNTIRISNSSSSITAIGSSKSRSSKNSNSNNNVPMKLEDHIQRLSDDTSVSLSQKNACVSCTIRLLVCQRLKIQSFCGLSIINSAVPYLDHVAAPFSWFPI